MGSGSLYRMHPSVSHPMADTPKLEPYSVTITLPPGGLLTVTHVIEGLSNTKAAVYAQSKVWNPNIST